MSTPQVTSTPVRTPITKSGSINRNRLVHRLGAIGPDISNQVTSVIKTLLNH